jgi:hypothetical protein
MRLLHKRGGLIQREEILIANALKNNPSRFNNEHGGQI